MKDFTARQVAALKPRRSPYRVSRNLYLQVHKGTRDGSMNRSWFFRYMRDGAPHWHGLGPYDLVSLAKAREKVLACRKLRLEGKDPIEEKQAEKQRAAIAKAASTTFEERGAPTSPPMRPAGATTSTASSGATRSTRTSTPRSVSCRCRLSIPPW